ncbi:hypothetical protein PCASD_10302 [Puccinia coronata f. sp. avenae]|uniref:Uncharacterized protein n=1 Tax=Puccinia coronata f. sp. avenae TaxID=200324 RepID=A0A2N5U7M2_9BASI|nr:hypothetical protein PCASD_10302 [Puccinia coronata f. sp. avenae]
MFSFTGAELIGRYRSPICMRWPPITSAILEKKLRPATSYYQRNSPLIIIINIVAIAFFGLTGWSATTEVLYSSVKQFGQVSASTSRHTFKPRSLKLKTYLHSEVQKSATAEDIRLVADDDHYTKSKLHGYEPEEETSGLMTLIQPPRCDRTQDHRGDFICGRCGFCSLCFGCTCVPA